MLSGVLWVALASMAVESALPGACDAVVVYRSGSEAYQEAIAGVRETLSRSPYRVDYVDQAAPPQKNCLDASPKLIVSIGVGAWQSLGATPRSVNVLPSIVLHGDVKPEVGRRSDAVYADVSLVSIADHLRGSFAGKSRLALIHRSSRTPPDPSAVARIRQLGFELHIADCPGPEKLLAVFSSLKGKADFVITEPDGELYNSATLKPLVLASLDLRLPIVGFSAAFVRAGALVGVYPDFRELGRQTGEAAQRILAGKASRGDEEPRTVVLAFNERIARLLGIEPSDKRGVLTFK